MVTNSSLIRCAGLLALGGFPLSVAHAGGLDSDRAYAAELRNQALSEGGWSPDQVRSDNSVMRLSGLSQTRYTYSDRKSGSAVPAGNTSTMGFSQPRTQFTLDGSLVSSRLTYRVTMDFGDAELGRGRGTSPTIASGTGAAVLLDAYAQYNFEGKREGYYLKVGQFRHVQHTEEAVEPQYQLAVERSLVNEFFNYGYTQGVALGRVDRDWAWEVSITDGGRYWGSAEIANSPLVSPFQADIAVAGRIDYKLKGNWEQFTDFTSFQGSQDAFRIGAGMMWMQQGETNPDAFVPPPLVPDLDRAQVMSWTVDAQYEGDGWNAFAAYMGNTIDWEFNDGQVIYMSNHGFVVHGGYFLNDKSELYARVNGLWFDDTISAGFGRSQGEPSVIATVGWNYYIIPESHAAKFTIDASMAMDDMGGLTAGFTSSDTLPDPSTTGFMGGSSTEYLIRAQFQILF